VAIGTLLIAALVVSQVLLNAGRYSRLPRRNPPPAGRLQGIPSGKLTRQQMREMLLAAGGKHLVMVRYGPHHNFSHEWVYNEADIDGAPIVWARAMDGTHNTRLIEYFKDRRVWSIEVD
jgi:hypothetical protein